MLLEPQPVYRARSLEERYAPRAHTPDELAIWYTEDYMRQLIVNADDFGYSPGVNRGLIEAHQKGIVTSTSVMVDAVAARKAAELSKYPALSVGLHFVPDGTERVAEALDKQFQKFISICGSAPTHIDIHKDTSPKEAVLAYAAERGIPARYSGQAKFIDSFFGSHSGGDVSVARLKQAIDEATDEVNEIMCHVGYLDDYLQTHSAYNDLREAELRSICDPVIKAYISSEGLQLINWTHINY